MFAKLFALFSRRHSVDSTLAALNKTVSRLEQVRYRKKEEADQHASAAAELVIKSNQATREAARADAVQAKLAALIA